MSVQKYEELLQGDSRREKIRFFAMRCGDALKSDSDLLAEVANLKKRGKRLPIMKRP